MTPRENILRDAIRLAKKTLFPCKPIKVFQSILETNKILTTALKEADKAKDVEIPKGPQIDPNKIPNIRTVEKSLGYGG